MTPGGAATPPGSSNYEAGNQALLFLEFFFEKADFSGDGGQGTFVTLAFVMVVGLAIMDRGFPTVAFFS